MRHRSSAVLSAAEWWETATEPLRLLKAADGKVSSLALWRFACACGRRVWDRWPYEQKRLALAAAERCLELDESADETARQHAAAELNLRWFNAWGKGAGLVEGWPRAKEVLGFASAHVAGAELCGLLREVLGNPFRPTPFAPQWRTETVLGIARTTHERGAFSYLPILADALEEAGCDLAEVLAHCRGSGPHVRGCWVLDLVLRPTHTNRP